MTNIFIVAAIVSLIYLIIKFFEMRHVEKESKPLKSLVKDALVVYFCVIIGDFIIKQIYSSAIMNGGGNMSAQVFTDNPNF